MKPLRIFDQDKSGARGQSCCAPSRSRTGLADDTAARHQAAQAVKVIMGEKPRWQTGIMNSASGLVPIVSGEWSRADRRGQIRARMGSFRMDYIVKPGLYAIGRPGASSEIFVSANYKLSFDILRRELAGISGWILVLDTKGVNVWCAAGKGTFGTDELVKRVLAVKLAETVSHRRLIVPQLGATGVRAAEVKKRTGFTVCFGPVEASDIKEYLAAGRHATPAMRTVRFGMARRLILTPIELNQAMRKFPLAALVVLAIFGLQPSGILFYNAWYEGWSFLALALAALLAGSFITPVLLPYIPFRSFSVKGLVTGAAAVVPLVLLTPLGGPSWFLKASEMTLFPLLSSYLALQFTGATTFTTISGVKRELKVWVPIYIAGLAVSAVLIVLHKIQSWGLL